MLVLEILNDIMYTGRNMYNKNIFSASLCLYRYIYTSNVVYNKWMAKQATFMSKCLNKSRPKRKWYTDDNRSQQFILPNTKEKCLSVHTTRRMTVLNKVFMQNISSLISIGKYNDIMIDRGIEILNVKITADFRYLNIFWAESKYENSNDKYPVSNEEILKECASYLRHEVAVLRIMSNVPIIQFVKDKSVSTLREVEYRLQTADFGDDLNINDITSNCDLIDKSNNSNDTQRQNITLCNVLPEMRHDILGLDHHLIMSKITNSLKKSKEPKKDARSSLASQISSSELPPGIVTNIITEKETKEIFAKFLAKRERDQRNRVKQAKRVTRNNSSDRIFESDSEDNYNSDYNEDDYTDDNYTDIDDDYTDTEDEA